MFLSGPSPIIGNACNADSRLVNLIEVTLVCEVAYSKIVEVVTVADEDRVGNSL